MFRESKVYVSPQSVLATGLFAFPSFLITKKDRTLTLVKKQNVFVKYSINVVLRGGGDASIVTWLSICCFNLQCSAILTSSDLACIHQ